MKNKLKIKTYEFSILFAVFLLAPVVFVSGCIEGGTLQSIFSSLTGQQEKIVAPNDVLLIENVQVIPNPPITADSTFAVTFQVINVGETSEGSKEATNVQVYAYDWGRCHPLDTVEENKIKAPIDPVIYSGGGADLVEFSFRSPTNTELGRMDGTCPIRYKVLYNYDTYTTSDLAVVSNERLVAAHRSGETISVTPVQTQSRGPLKISVDFEADQPVDQNLIIPAVIKIYDKGSGMYEKIPAGWLKIEFPDDFTSVTCSPSTWMGSLSGNTVTNSADIPLIKGESSPMRCDIRLDPDVVVIEDIRTYNIVAKIIGYTYPLYGEKVVDIKTTYGEWEEENSGGGTTATTSTTSTVLVCSVDCPCAPIGICGGDNCAGTGDECDSDECCCCP